MDKKIPDGVVLTAAYALSKEWNLHYPDAVRMAALVLSVGQQHPEWQPVEDGPIDANNNAEYIEHCADVLEQRGLRVTAGALRVIAHEHRTLAKQAAAAHEPCAAVAAIQFALTDPEGMTFLRLWNEGEFDTLRREWPDALRKVYDGADPLAQQPTACPRHTHHVHRAAESLPCYCHAKDDHPIGSEKPVGAEDIEVLKRLRAALPDVGLNGWWLGVEVLNRVIDALDTKQGGA